MKPLMTQITEAKETIYLIIISILLLPVLIMWHEMGHYVVVKILGGSAIIRPTSIWFTPDFSNQLTPTYKTLVTAGATIFDLTLFTTATILLCSRRSNIISQTTTIYEKCLFVVSLFSMRWWFLMPMLYLHSLFIPSNFNNMDEVKISEALGLGSFGLLWMLFVVGGLISFFALKYWPKKRRIFDTIIISVSTQLSLIIWSYWLGPFLKTIYRTIRHMIVII